MTVSCIVSRGDAIAFAAQVHDEQVDKCGVPYIFHPLRVMMAVAERLPANEPAQMAAVLHDVVEDHGVDLEMHQCLTEVVRLVEIVTRRPQEVYADFITRCGKDPVARIIKVCDRRDNLSRPLPPEMAGIHRRYRRALEALGEVP